VDRRALPAPAKQKAWRFVAPRTLSEELLAAIWSELLGVSEISIEDNFLATGGHSLLITRAIASIKQVFQVDISVQSFFEARCLADLASLIAERQPALQTLRMIAILADRPLSALAPRQRALVLAHLKEQRADDNDIPAMVPVERTHTSFPLSLAQQRLWFLYQEAPQDPAYAICAALQLHGSLNVIALQRSIHHLVQRHESLRTIFLSGEGQVLLPAAAVPLLLLDLKGLAPSVRAEVVRLCADEESQRPFRLEYGPLLRCTLVHQKPDEHTLLLSMHQMISDSRSMEIFLQELAHLYPGYARGEQPQLPALSMQYIDFAIWQRRWLRGARVAQLEAYWREQLRDVVRLDFSADTLYPLHQTSAGAALRFQLGMQLVADLQALSHQAGASMFMTLLGAFLVVLQRHTGREDLLVGTPSLPRNRVEVEQVIGLFIDLLALRVHLSDNLSFREVLTRVRTATVAACDHQDVPAGQVVDLVHSERDGSRSPLLQIIFALQQAPQWVSGRGEITAQRSPLPGRLARFDLALELVETPQGFSGSLQYRTTLFEAATIQRLGEQYQRLLEALAAAPDVAVGQLLSEVEEA
jgi:acyl carrier protein